MVLNCVANGCNVLHDARNKISFHSFPFKRPEILQLWIAAVQRRNWYPSKTSKLCGQHFVKTDYLIKPGCTAKLLKPDAVPSVFPCSKHSVKKVSLPQTEVCTKNDDTDDTVSSDIEIKIEPLDINIGCEGSAPPIPVTNAKVFVHQSTQISTTNQEETIRKLRREIKSLKQKLQRRDIEISSMKEVIHKITSEPDFTKWLQK